MRPPVVPWPVLAILLVLLLAAPVLAAGGSPGSGNSAGGEGAAGTGGQSSAMSGSSLSGVATVSGPDTSGNQGEGTHDGSSPENSAWDSSSSSLSGSAGTLSYEGTAQSPGSPGSGDGTDEAVSVGKSGQDTAGNRQPSMSADANRGNSVETDSPGGTQQQVREGPADETNGAAMSSLAGDQGRSPEQRGTQVQARGGEEVQAEGTQARSEAGTNSNSVRGAGYAPGWSYARAGTLTETPVPASTSTDTPAATGATVPSGTPGTRGRGQGAENRPTLPPGHVPYGEVPYGHVPYGPNPAATTVTSAQSTSEEPRRVTRHRNAQQAAIEVASEESRSPAAFPLIFPPLLPLGYRRIFGKNVLANSSRKHIYDHICGHPGTDLNGITAACGMNRETVRYHLRQLTAYRKITLLSADGNTRYFQNHGLFSMRDQMVIHHMEKGTTGEILRYISAHRGSTRQDIAEYLGIAGPTVSRHLATLVREGLVITKKEGKFLRCELGTDVVLPGSLIRSESKEPQQGTCAGT